MNFGGIIYGLLRGIILIYLTLAIISFLAPMIQGNFVKTIDQSAIGGPLYRNNLLLNIITR